MRRTRTINAAPQRSASQTVRVLSALIQDSLAQADIDPARVDRALTAASPALLMLVSGRHLSSSAVVLVAADAVCELYCRYDDAAVDTKENLRPVPGMSNASEFTLHLPAVGQLRDIITDVVTTNSDLAVAAVPDLTARTSTPQAATTIDLDSLRQLL